MRAVGIFVAYTNTYYSSALEKFTDLVNALSPAAHVIVVNNNQFLDIESSPGTEVILGSNSLQEFGAWQEGLAHALPTGNVENDCFFVFGNDTLCHHRSFERLEHLAFIRAFQKTWELGHPGICGQQSSFGRDFSINGSDVRKWVCTYLFGMNQELIRALDSKISLTQTELSSLVPGGLIEEEFFSRELDPTLRHHLIGWLFGRPGLNRWRNSNSLTAENAQAMRRKAFSIINEKMLTARSIQHGASVIDPLNNIPVRALKGVRKIHRIISQ